MGFDAITNLNLPSFTAISCSLHVLHTTPTSQYSKMSTWSSKPDESWGGGGAADAPTVNEDYANVDGIDTEPIEEEKKLQRIRKKDIEQ